jgi:ubiquitin-protein ligase
MLFPPQLFFMTRIWHPDVEIGTGKVCKEKLAVMGWDESMGLKQVLAYIRSMIGSPIVGE